MITKSHELRSHALCIVAYVVSTFLVQGSAHFVLFAAHYASIPILRPEPKFALGLSSMVIQGTLLSYVLVRSRFHSGRVLDAMRLAWCFGAFLLSYIALAEAGKYAIADIPAWIATESATALVQYTLIGLAFGLIHRHPKQLTD
jgi:hypothetical protein